MDLEQELNDRVARRAIHLMPQPQAALRLRTLVADPAHTLAQVVDAVRLDPLMAAAVMRIANSAAQARAAVCTLPAAATRIGEKELARLALASGLGAATSEAGPLLALRRAAMQDALTSALICQRLAGAFGLDPERLFLEGLLHDVGRLVALATLELILAQHPQTPPRDAGAWHALAQRHHVELGRVLCERWGLPENVRQAIARHHQPDDGTRDGAALVRLGDELLALLHAGTALGEASLPWLERVEPSRRAALLEALAAVPALVAAFEAERTPTAPSPHLCAPAPRPEARTGARCPVRVSGGRSGEAVLRSPRLLLLRTRPQLPDNYLAEVELQWPGAPLQLWVRVTQSLPPGADGLAEAEAAPFAPTRAVARRLQELWHTAEPTERAA